MFGMTRQAKPCELSRTQTGGSGAGRPATSRRRAVWYRVGVFLCRARSFEGIYLPQQAQTIESISGHTYICKRISLTFFVKKLILWSKGLSQRFLSDATYFICRAVTFLNEIDLPPHNSYYLRNTIKLIRRSSSIINEFIYPISPCNVKQKAPPN